MKVHIFPQYCLNLGFLRLRILGKFKKFRCIKKNLPIFHSFKPTVFLSGTSRIHFGQYQLTARQWGKGKELGAAFILKLAPGTQ